MRKVGAHLTTFPSIGKERTITQCKGLATWNRFLLLVAMTHVHYSYVEIVQDNVKDEVNINVIMASLEL